MDGHFVPNIVMGAPVIECVGKAVPGIFMDCHMMVSEPLKVRGASNYSGSSRLQRRAASPTRSISRRQVRWGLTTGDPIETARQIKAAGMRACVALNPGTPATEVSDSLARAVDMILVMTVWPGAGGQKFIQECMPKVAELRARFPDLDVEVDGGVKPETIGACADAGANVIVAGTAVFKDPAPQDVIKYLRDACEKAQQRIRDERTQILRGEKISGAGLVATKTYLEGDLDAWCHPRAYIV